MKKIILFLLGLSLCLCLFSACGPNEGIFTTSATTLNGTSTSPSLSMWDLLSGCASADYRGFTLALQTRQGNLSVESTYTVTFGNPATVTYRVETLNTFVPTEGGYIAPDAYKTVAEGIATYQDGQWTETTGEPIALPTALLTPAGLHFDKTNFAAVTFSDTAFSAIVTDPDGFLGQKDCGYTDMHVDAAFSTAGFTGLTLTWVTSSGSLMIAEFLFR